MKKIISIELPVELIKQLKAIAKNSERSFSAEVRIAIAQYLERQAR